MNGVQSHPSIDDAIDASKKVDIEDFSGITQRNIAERARDPEVRRRLLDVLDGKA